jgi:hypothetical protein
MKKLISLLALFFSPAGLFAQEIQTVSLPSGNNLVFGDSIVVKMSGESTFFPLLNSPDSDIPGDLFRSEETLLDWIVQATEGVPVQDQILAMTQQIARVLKSDIFVNSALYPRYWDHFQFGEAEQVFAKDYAMPGMFTGSYSLQCGEYAQSTASLLMKTGLVSLSETRLGNSGRHVFLEIFHEDKWKTVDTDPGTPVFMTENHLNHEEVRDLGADAAMDEFRIHYYQPFRSNADSSSVFNKDGLDGSSDSLRIVEELSAYYLSLADTELAPPYPIYPPRDWGTVAFDGAIRLSDGVSIEISYVNDRLFFDTLAYPEIFTEIRGLYLNAKQSLEEGNTIFFEIYVTNLILVLAEHFQQETELVADHLFDGDISFGDIWLPDFDRDQIPQVVVILPSGDYVIGEDVAFPGRVLKVEASIGSEVYFRDPWGNDTLIQGGDLYMINFWESEADSSAFVPNRVNQYLQQGWIHAMDTVRIHVSYNPVIFNFLRGDLSIEIIEGDTLDIEYLVNGVNLLVDDLVTSITSGEQESFLVYPNPTSGAVSFPMGDATLYDLQGRIIKICTECNSFDVSNLSSGVYVLRHAGYRSPVRLVVQ